MVSFHIDVASIELYDLEYHENQLGQLYGSLFVYFKIYTDAKGEMFTNRKLVKECVFVYLLIK